MTAFTSFVTLAQELIAKKGQAIMLRVPGTDVVDPVADTASGLDPLLYDGLVGVVLPVPKDMFDPGTMTRMRSRLVIMPAQSTPVTPEAKCELFFDNAWWTIRDVMTIAPDGTAILHKCTVVQ